MKQVESDGTVKRDGGQLTPFTFHNKNSVSITSVYFPYIQYFIVSMLL